MPSKPEMHSGDVKIDQMPPIDDISKYDGDVVVADAGIADRDYLAELKFMSEPVTIRLQPSTDRNAATSFPCWVNGVPAEVFQRGKWTQIGYLPVAQVLVVKRSVLEVILKAKVDTVTTQVVGQGDDSVDNRVNRFTTPVHSVSVIEDKNPKGGAWMTEIIRRSF